MSIVIIPIIWVSTIFNACSIFYGLELWLRPIGVRGDLLCFVAAFVLVSMSIASSDILNGNVPLKWVFWLIWGISLCTGFYLALIGNFSFLELISQDAQEPHYQETVKQGLTVFLTALFAFLSALHSHLPEGARVQYLFQKSKADEVDKDLAKDN